MSPEHSDLATAFYHAPNEIFFVDAESLRFTWLNANAEEKLGYSAEEIPSTGPLGIVDAASRAELESAIEALANDTTSSATEKPRRLKMSLAGQDKTAYQVESQLQLFTTNGKKALVMFSQDLSEKLQLAGELDTALMYLESAPDATVIVDQIGKIVASNAQIERLLGYSKSDILGKPVECLIPERFKTSHIAHRGMFERNPQTRGMGAELNLFALAKSGQEIPIEVSLNPVVAGSQTLVAAALRDTTQRKAAEQALRTSEARHRELFNNASDLIQSFDATGKLEFVNPAWCKATGYSQAELGSLSISELICPHSETSAQQLIDRLQAESKVASVQVTYTTKSGTKMHLEGSASVQSLGGEQSTYQAIFHDVTQRRRYENSLRESKEQAEQATAGKSRFLAAASHDLRQPLQALRLYLSVLDRLIDDSKQRDVALKMERSVDTMGELLDALLDISRLDSGAITPEPADFSTDSLLENILSSNSQQANEKGLTLRRTGNDYLIHTDPGLLSRIIDNFVTNAIRYTERGGVTLDASRTQDGITLAVIDSGIGIHESEIARVFEEYFQLDNGVRDRKKGLGLGLSIVKHIAALLKLKVEVVSVPDEGSEFRVTVPESAAAPVSNNIDQLSATIAKHGSIRVLFVDDDEAIVDATAMLLATEEFEVITALSGEEALQSLRPDEQPHVLISDYRLPKMNGAEVIQRVREFYAIELPAILMSGDTSITELAQNRLENCALLRKPVDTNELILQIRELAEQSC